MHQIADGRFRFRTDSASINPSHLTPHLRRRLRATALVTGGRLSRTGVASAAGVGVRTLRDRVVRYSADGLDGLRDAARPGAPPKLDGGQAGEVASWLDGGPDPDAGRPSRRAVADVRKRIADSLRVGCALEGARRPVRRPGFRHMSPRPVHPRADPAAREGFGGDSVRLAREAVPDGVAPEDVPVYLQDGARVGQKGMLSRVWARKGTRPRVVRDHRYGHLYLFPPPPVPRRATRSGMCAAGPTRSGWAGTSGRSGSGSPPESAPWWSPAGRAGTGRGTWGYRTASPCPGCRPRPGAQSGRDGFLRAEHRHFANRVSGSAEHVRETVERAWDAFIRRKGEVTRITTREWAVP